MKVGDVVRVYLPHDKSDGSHGLVFERITWSAANPETDVWWNVLMEGEVKTVHQDYMREVINEGR